MKRLFSLSLCLLTVVLSFAEDFSWNGILYNITSSSTVEVTYKGVSAGAYSSYSGAVTIPSSVTYKGKTYSVTSIGRWAFLREYSLTSVTIPGSVTSIGHEAFEGCTKLTKIIVKDIAAWCNISFDAYKDNPLYYVKHLYSDGNTEITDLVIPDGVTSISDYAFEDCTGLTSVTIPNSVTSISSSAFSGCSALTDVTLNSNAIVSNTNTSSSSLSSIFGSQVSKYTIGEGVTSIGDYAFRDCRGLTDIRVADGNTTYDSRDNCNAIVETSTNTLIVGCKNTTIPSSVTSIGSSAFRDCSGLTSVTIPNSVTTIGSYAFAYCSGLTSVTIPNSVTSIGNKAFASCSKLTSINIPSSVTTIGSSVFSGCSGLTSINIPSSVTSIGDDAFSYCSGLTRVTIPSSVTSIGGGAFYGCSGLTKVILPDIAKWCSISFNSYSSNPLYYAKHLYSDENSEISELAIPDGVTSIGDYAFSYCTGLKSVTIPESVTSIGKYAFHGCASLTDVILNSNAIVSRESNPLKDIFGSQIKNCTIGDGVLSVGGAAFSGCSELTSVTIPSTVTNIGSLAFQNCSGLTSITIPSNLTSIGGRVFDGCSKLSKIYVKKGSWALIAAWISMPSNATVYDLDMTTKLPKPYMTYSSTQTSLTFKIQNHYKEYTYSLTGGTQFVNGTATVTGLLPATKESRTLYVNGINLGSVEATTSPMGVQIPLPQTTASSVNVYGTYTKGDANVVSTSMTFNGKTVEGNSISVKGLNPNTKYTAKYDVVVAYGQNNAETKTYTKTVEITTANLTLKTGQPKVVSLGNVIVGATTNVDDAETNVGFEWRREDWSSEIASSTGAAVAYNGTIEGYIRNLNAEKLWRYRAYYLADNGRYYYGDWIGIDPSNTSYFEPTVRTYANVSVKGNTALVKGYTLRGTDKVMVQGFKYWRTANSGNSLDVNVDNEVQASSIPADAMAETVDIVGSGQQLMNASLKNLDYSSTYHYVAFVTTAENETFYGEEQMFTTEAAPAGIEEVKEGAGSSKAVTVVAYYDLNGKRLSQPQKGLNILRMSDGTTRKIVSK